MTRIAIIAALLLLPAAALAQNPYEDYYDTLQHPDNQPVDNDAYYTAPGPYPTDNDAYYQAPYYPPAPATEWGGNGSTANCNTIGEMPSCSAD